MGTLRPRSWFQLRWRPIRIFRACQSVKPTRGAVISSIEQRARIGTAPLLGAWGAWVSGGASCGRVRRRKPALPSQPTSARARVKRRKTLLASLAALNSARTSSPVPLKSITPRIGSFHRSPETQVRAWSIRAISKVGLFESHNKSRQLAFRELSRKTVVSKWYPQLSQVHKCRTQRSFTCSDQSGAINASPHCAQGLKYLGRADRGLVAVSRDISKPPKIAAPILGGP
jgi:hypothetical protein